MSRETQAGGVLEITVIYVSILPQLVFAVKDVDTDGVVLTASKNLILVKRFNFRFKDFLCDFKWSLEYLQKVVLVKYKNLLCVKHSLIRYVFRSPTPKSNYA